MKKILVVLCVSFCCIALFAHTPLLSIEGTGDGSLYIEGGFSNGASAAGVKLYLKNKETGEVLWDGVFPENSSITLPIPNVPYTVTFDGGPGHIITKDGIEPPNGFGGENMVADDSTIEESGQETNESEELTDTSTEETGTGEEQEESIELVNTVEWNPIDTMAVTPKMLPSFVAMVALVLSVINFILLIFVLRKKSKK